MIAEPRMIIPKYFSFVFIEIGRSRGIIKPSSIIQKSLKKKEENASTPLSTLSTVILVLKQK